jgi:cytoskeleton protein RodZ
LPSFGNKLKQEREKRKISLEQISVTTKIGTRMLQALEEDKFNQLPGGIFNKGFVRAYSRCLGLDEDQIVAEYLLASGDAPPPRTEIAVREDEARENEEHVRRLESNSEGPLRQLPWGWFAALLLVVALALSLWTRHQRERGGQSLHPAPSSAVNALTPEQASGKPTDPNTPNPNVANNAGSQDNGPRASAAGSRTPAYRAPGSPTAGEFTVVLHAREESWISVTVDGRAIASQLLSEGSDLTVRGQKEIIVKAGNAGGVDVRFNGQKVDTGAGYGEVRTLTFGSGGLLAAPPAPPSAH